MDAQEGQIVRSYEAKLTPNLRVRNPDWSKHVVWYQIVPERFCNGDPSNDPTPDDIIGAYPYYVPEGWQITPWNIPLEQAQPHELKPDDIHTRRYGGDLQGIIEKLDDIQELGINGIYLTPVFTSPSSHKYDAHGYNHIDPNFGPDPAGDRELIKQENPVDPSTWQWTSADLLMLELVDEVHRRGMYIILNGVFNHIGMTSPFFQDALKNREHSPYWGWFTFRKVGDSDQLDWDCWATVKDLPAWARNENGIVEGPMRYIKACTTRWMLPMVDGVSRDGIDGWLLDVAQCVPHETWKQWSAFVRRIDRSAFMPGGIFHEEDGSLPVTRQLQPYFEGDELTTMMNFPLAALMAQFFFEAPGLSPSDFDQRLAQLRNKLPREAVYTSQNHTGTHDTVRLATHIVNSDRLNSDMWLQFMHDSKMQHGIIDIRKPTEEERRIQKTVVLFQIAYVGQPMFLYGDERGLLGGADPHCRQPMPWDNFDQALWRYYRDVIHIRREHNALQVGDYSTLLVDNDRNLFAFERSDGEEKIIAVFNNRKVDQECTLPLPAGDYVDLLSPGQTVRATAAYGLKLRVSAKSGLLLKAID
jgi:glycosidase